MSGTPHFTRSKVLGGSFSADKWIRQRAEETVANPVDGRPITLVDALESAQEEYASMTRPPAEREDDEADLMGPSSATAEIVTSVAEIPGALKRRRPSASRSRTASPSKRPPTQEPDPEQTELEALRKQNRRLLEEVKALAAAHKATVHRHSPGQTHARPAAPTRAFADPPGGAQIPAQVPQASEQEQAMWSMARMLTSAVQSIADTQVAMGLARAPAPATHEPFRAALKHLFQLQSLPPPGSLDALLEPVAWAANAEGSRYVNYYDDAARCPGVVMIGFRNSIADHFSNVTHRGDTRFDELMDLHTSIADRVCLAGVINDASATRVARGCEAYTTRAQRTLNELHYEIKKKIDQRAADVWLMAANATSTDRCTTDRNRTADAAFMRKLSNGTQSQHQQQNERRDNCKKCHMRVKFGGFREHNKVCPKRKPG